MSSIRIQSMTQQKTETGCDVEYQISIREHPYALQYHIEGDMHEVPECCDGVVTTFLLHAMRNGLDIISDVPISKKLLYNIRYHIVPGIYGCNPQKTTNISLDMPVTDERYEGDWVGTGVSLGVDSFATIHEYLEDAPFEDYKLTHLVHLKVGAHHGNLGYFDKEVESDLFAAEQKKVQAYCKEFGFNLVTVESNLFEICNIEFGFIFGITHALVNLGTIMQLQGRFSKYCYASGYALSEFKVDSNDDMSHYEKWLIPYLATENIEFFSANKDMGRMEKTKYICRFPDTYDYLHVCWHNEKNCGKCAKCIRTLTTLDLLGAVQNYKNVFDVDAYYKDRYRSFCRVAAMRGRDPLFAEIYDYMKENGIKTPNPIAVFWTKICIFVSAVRGKLRTAIGKNK